MTLTAKFNLKAKAKRRTQSETDTFGGRSLSRYFSTVAFGSKHQRKIEIEVLQIHAAAPVRVRGMQPRM
jgi:hypothetical protein